MKVFLDDIREAPDASWVEVRDYDTCIKVLETGMVTQLSLDHDLGDPLHDGYDVAVWIEEKVWKEGFYPPLLFIHSANPVGRRRIQAAIDSIVRGNTFNR